MRRWDTSSTIDIHRCGRSRGCCFVRFISSSRRWEFIHFLCRSQWFLGAVAASCETIDELPVPGRWASTASWRANSIRRHRNLAPRLRHSAAYPEIGDKKREYYGDWLLALVKAVEG